MNPENENNLDRFLKQAVDQKSFDFDPVYWEGAKALLDQDKKKKRRGIFLWWGLGGTGLLGVLAVSLLLNSTLFFPQNKINKRKIEAVVNNSSEVSNPNADLISTSTNTSFPSQLNVPADHPESKNQIQDKSQKQNAFTEINYNSFKQKGEITKTQPVSSRRDVITESRLQTDFPPLNSLSGTSYVGGQAKPVLNITSDPEATSPTLKPDKLQVHGLPAINFIPHHLSNTPEFEKNNMKTHLQPDYNRNSGILAALHLEALLAPWDGGRVFGGIRAGLAVKYPLSQLLFINTGLLYAQIHQLDMHTRLNEQIVYDFGSQTQYFVMTGHSAHLLQVPLALGKSFERHDIYGGYQVNYLLGLQGNIQEVSLMPSAARSRKVQEVINDVQTGWLDMSPLHQVQHELLLGYTFNFRHGLVVGMHLNYRLTNYLRTPPDIDYKEPGKLHAGIYIRLNFN